MPCVVSPSLRPSDDPQPVNLESKLHALTIEERLQADENETEGTPILELSGSFIDDVTISRLATTLLGHVLYLKNQIPFPVAQLAKIYARENAAEIQTQKQLSKASKLRDELLNTFDLLSSHLDTTFSSISDALAKSKNPKKPKTTKAFLVIVVGPSLTTPRTRVIFGIDGLQVKLWGIRDDDDDDLDSDSSDEYESEDESAGEETSPGIPLPPPDASRLLSRLLSTTPHALSLTELSPSQVHILIRGPRRFSHPSWVAKQQLSKSFDKMIDAFQAGEKIKNVEGVWVRAKDQVIEELEDNPDHSLCTDEDDEMIWWSWDGKLVGFAG